MALSSGSAVSAALRSLWAVVSGVAFLVAAPPFAWYAELLVVFVAFVGWRSIGWIGVVFAGSLRDGKVGPHPISQFEIHFPERALSTVRPVLEASGLTVLIHPLTHDDLADHTTLADWIGTPIELDVSVLDPPGVNQGFDRYGKSDF